MRRSLILLLSLAISCSSGRDKASVEQATIAAHPITGAAGDYDPLMHAIGDARLVLLGEATHGTHEFYAERARISRRLIEEKGLRALALEADWTDVARVDRYVRGQGSDGSAAEALGDFRRFPRWMWRNEEFASLVQWIREYNAAQPADGEMVRIFGVDVYGVESSLPAVVEHLERVDAQLAKTVQERYACLTPYAGNMERYGRTAALQTSRSCQTAVTDVLELLESRLDRARSVGDPQLEQWFNATQNARVVRNGEAYFREGAVGRVSTWNLRDHHMVDTMRSIQQHLVTLHGRDGMIVWAHNSHVGDARATDRTDIGELNMGQLVRQGTAVGSTYIVGFSTNTGTVVAATNWGEPPQVKRLNSSIRGSHGALLHATGIPAFLLILETVEQEWAREPRLQRAVGVIYRPQTEYQSHYYRATLAEQFDAVIHIDVTRALTPLDR